MGNYKITNRLFVILIFISSTFISPGQTNGNEYYPLKPNLKAKYYIDNNGDSLYFELLSHHKQLNKHLYITEQGYRIYKGGISLLRECYYRNESGNVYIIYDGEKSETLFLPFRPKVGQTWFLSDKGWQWKVVSIDATFTAASGKFNDLLKIQEFDLEIPEDTATYFSYFKKGIGLIARTRNGVIEMEYIVQK